MEVPDCRVCENCQTVNQVIPSEDKPAIVRRWYKCIKTGKIFLTTDDLKKTFVQCSYRKPRIGYGLPSDIIDEIENINFIVKTLINTDKKLIEVKPEVATLIASPCYSTVDFELKVGALASILEMNIKILRKLLDKYGIPYKEDEKSLKLLEKLFQAKRIEDTTVYEALDYLKKIVSLRNKLPPFHKPSAEEARKIMQDLGIQYPAESSRDWQINSEILLRRFLDSIRAIRKALRTLATSES